MESYDHGEVSEGKLKSLSMGFSRREGKVTVFEYIPCTRYFFIQIALFHPHNNPVSL